VSRLEPTLSLDGMFENFKAAGWKHSPRVKGTGSSFDRQALFWKVLRRSSECPGRDPSGNAVCITNDKLSLHVTLEDLYVNGKHHGSATYSIVGEYRPEMWTKLEIYGVSWDEAVEERTRYETELLAAWDALCAVARV